MPGATMEKLMGGISTGAGGVEDDDCCGCGCGCTSECCSGHGVVGVAGDGESIVAIRQCLFFLAPTLNGLAPNS